MRSAGLSDIGLVRKVNEDNFLCIKLNEYLDIEDDVYIFMVADGMGGAKAGEIASKMAVTEVLEYIKQNYTNVMNNNNKDEDIFKVLNKAIEHSNDKIYKKSILDSECSGMGTTLSLTLIIKNNGYFAHVGDSRIYLIRDNSIVKLTEDHSLVAELVKNGSIKPEEAINHPQKNIITKALGTDYSIEADNIKHILKSGDNLIICSDGLSNMVSDQELIKILTNASSLDSACTDMISCAKSRGGNDNITVVIIEVCKGGEEQ